MGLRAGGWGPLLYCISHITIYHMEPMSWICKCTTNNCLLAFKVNKTNKNYGYLRPVNATSASLRIVSSLTPGLLSQSNTLQPCCSSSRLGHRNGAVLRSSRTTPQLNLHQCHLIKTPKNSRFVLFSRCCFLLCSVKSPYFIHLLLTRCNARPDATTFETLDDKVSASSFKVSHSHFLSTLCVFQSEQLCGGE